MRDLVLGCLLLSILAAGEVACTPEEAPQLLHPATRYGKEGDGPGEVKGCL